MAELPAGTVTFMLTDLEGSTRLWEERPGPMASALVAHDAILREAVESAGGVVVDHGGDGMCVAFASASDAVGAGLQFALRIAASDDAAVAGLLPRVALHAGGGVLRADGRYVNQPLNRCARLMAAGHGGQVLVSESVEVLVRDALPPGAELIGLGEHRLRDLARPMRVFQLVHPELRREFPPLGSLDAVRSNLPDELSAFVGRVGDLEAVVERLSRARIVSLVGTGGVGKTRLALRVGSAVLPGFADGVWLCELADLRDADAVPEAVAAALGYAPSQGMLLSAGLAVFFRNKQLLLILDNCEHLARGVADFVIPVTRDAPGLSVLVTSREALGIRGESVYPLGSLALPENATTVSVEESEAGALFTMRSSEARGTFAVTPDNAAAVRDVCAQLEGLPLAIELAAARTATMSPAEILERLDHRLRILSGGHPDGGQRHQTLRSTIEWSYDLLDDTEKGLLGRLSVFVGGFDLIALTAMAADVGLDEFEALDRLGSLVAKSLVERSEADSVTRYRLLETIRQFAGEQLDAAGATGATRDRHGSYYLDLGRELFAQLNTAGDFEALDRLRLETPNLAAAGRWLLEADRLAEVIGFFADAGWVDTGLLPFTLMDELGRLADETVQQSGASELRGYAHALYYGGMRALFVGDLEHLRQVVALGLEPGDHPAPVRHLEMGEASTRGDFASATSAILPTLDDRDVIHDPGKLSSALALLALVESPIDPRSALVHAEESVDVARQTPATTRLLFPLLVFTIAARPFDTDRALAAAEECDRIDRTDRRAYSVACQGLAAKIQIERGAFSAGLERWRDVLRRFEWSGELGQISFQLPVLADAIADRDPTLAIQIAAIGDSNAIAPFATSGLLAAPGFEKLASAVSQLGNDALETAQARARSMSYDDAITFIFDAIDGLLRTNEGLPR